MIEAVADATVPAAPAEVFATATDLEHADWLPAVRSVRRVRNSPRGVGARYEVSVGIVGRRLQGVLVCRELDPPRRALYVLEDGLDLRISVDVEPVPGGSRIAVAAAYAVPGGPFGGAVGRATAPAARREVARAVEQLSAHFGRKTPTPRRRRA